jgi:hypothetical protein
MGGVNAQYSGTDSGIPQASKPGQIDVTSGGNFRFQPVSGVEAVSAHPEAVMQGLGQGLASAVGGIGSAYMKTNKTPAAQPASQPMSAFDWTSYGQAASQIPAAYQLNATPTFNQVANVGTGMNFVGNPFL